MRKKSKKKKAGIIAGRFVLVFLTTLTAVVLALAMILAIIIKGPSVSARNTFVSTVLESGALKFLASIYLSEEEIQDIVDQASMEKLDTEVQKDLIHVSDEVEGNFDENGVEIISINKSDFYATLMIVKDPSKVCVASTYANGAWSSSGENLDVIIKNSGALGGVNGGLYNAVNNSGSTPYGVCVSSGVIQYNDLSTTNLTGLVMIGLGNDNILRVQDLSGWSAKQFEEYVESEGIRDAVAFQEESSDSNNHFVQLVINGEARQMNGVGSGQNPRTVIGQRADGAILLLVTDGRWASGHPGATASDLISIMLKYGAVNAANLDGGSSSCMYYNNQWYMNSVTLHSTNKSWRLPTAVVVMGGE